MNHRLIQGDVVKVLPKLPRFHCLIADPPDNLGLDYDGYNDNLPPEDYLRFFRQWLCLFTQRARIVWVSFNACHLFDVATLLTANRFYGYRARLFINSFTFGQHRNSDCGNGYRPLLRLAHPNAPLYPDAIRVPSARQTKYKDKRANPQGKVPLDVWQFSRVCGTFHQRRSWHPTQLPEELIQRIILFSTKPGDAICDCFSGTGTALRAVNRLGPFKQVGGYLQWPDYPRNPVTSIEVSPTYCQHIADEHRLKVEQLP